MSNFTIARVRDPNRDMLSETYQTFKIMRDGICIGEVKYDRGRWKNAGGPAWKGINYVMTSGGQPVIYYHHNKAKVLEWFKTGICA